MSTIHVKYGLEFQPELYRSHNRMDWLEAVGKELENKEVILQLGSSQHPVEIANTQELKEFYLRYESQPEKVGSELGLEPGRDLQRFLSDFVQALDDIVKPSSLVKAGSRLDLRPNSEMSKMLGLDDSSVRYASSRSAFAKAASVEGATSVLGVMLTREAASNDPLDGQMYIDASTFEGRSLKSGRRNHEFEAVRRLGGLDTEQLIDLLRTEREGKPVLKHIRKAKDAEAFSLGFSGVSINEMRWDRQAHSIREENPYISLTVETGRLEKDEEQGEYEVDLSTDYNEDAYYDTPDYTLLKNEMTVRGRIRRDDPEPTVDAVRRVLIQSKIGSSVDATGTKSASKADIRKNAPTLEDIEGIDEDVRTGISEWGWGADNEQPIEAIGLVHKELAERGELPTIGEHKDVLQLEARAYVRSTRSRFHFNETKRSANIALFQEAGEPNIKQAMSIVAKSDSLDPAVAQSLQSLGQSLIDRTAILERTQHALMELDPALKSSGVDLDTIAALWPDQDITSDKLETKKRQIVADAIKSAYDEFADLLNNHKEAISGTNDTNGPTKDLTQELVEFFKSKNPDTLYVTTVGPFLEKLDEALASPEKEAFLQEFAAWAKDKGYTELSDSSDKDGAIANIRKALVSEHIAVVHRQIEASGSSGKNLWFDSARKSYANSIRANGSNLLIDTFDLSEFYTPEVWESLTEEQKAGAEEIPVDKMYHAMVVNEVQIELRSEVPFLNAIENAETSITQAKSGILMDFALSHGGIASPNKPESFQEWVQGILEQPLEERTATLESIRQFAKEKGSTLDIAETDLSQMQQANWSTEHQGQDYSTHASLVDDLDMSTFIWGEMIGIQEYIADLRGRRVKQEAAKSGLQNVAWENSNLSKGDTALTLLRDGTLPSAS